MSTRLFTFPTESESESESKSMLLQKFVIQMSGNIFYSPHNNGREQNLKPNYNGQASRWKGRGSERGIKAWLGKSWQNCDKWL